MNERGHIDLFSGIGGFAISASWAGYTTRVFCEQDKYCTRVLNRHWPDVPVIPDIRDFDGTQWRGSRLLTGGFPCQPFSVAGEHRGKKDDRYLWPEMCRVIEEARPSWVIAENVTGIIEVALDENLCTKLSRKDVPTRDALSCFVDRKMYFPAYVPLVDPAYHRKD